MGKHSMVVFSSIQKDDSIIKKVTIDWYLVLVGCQDIWQGVYGRR